MTTVDIAPTFPKNPIYCFVKDLITEKNLTEKCLREITGERWQKLSQPVASLFSHLVHEQYEDALDDGEQSPDDSILTTTLSSADNQLQKELNLLSDFFGDKPSLIDQRFTILSAHVFAHTRYMVIPAEVGLTRYSIAEGIVDSLHSLVDPGTIPVAYVKDALDYTDEIHGIPHDGKDYPNMAILLRAMHSMMHSVCGGHAGTGWVFIEDGEIEPTTAVLRWFEDKSTSLGLGLDWRLQPIRLSSLWIYLKEYNGELLYDDRDRFAFKTSIYDYLELCRFHMPQDHPNCALSKAHIYSYVLSRKFARKFEVDMVMGRHMPFRGANWYF